MVKRLLVVLAIVFGLSFVLSTDADAQRGMGRGLFRGMTGPLPGQAGRLSGGGGAAAPDTTFCGTTGASDLLCEDFEGAVTCTDDALSQANCRVAWTGSSTGTINNQAAGLEGTYGKSIDGSSGNLKTTYAGGWSTVDPTYGFYRIRFTNLTYTGAATNIFSVRTASATALAYINVVYNTDHYEWAAQVGAAAPVAILSPAPADDTTFYIWWSWDKDTTSTFTVWISSTVTKPGEASGTATGGSTNFSAARVYIHCYGGGSGELTHTVDRIRVGNVAFGDDT